jgi:hypothetical protein
MDDHQVELLNYHNFSRPLNEVKEVMLRRIHVPGVGSACNSIDEAVALELCRHLLAKLQSWDE